MKITWPFLLNNKTTRWTSRWFGVYCIAAYRFNTSPQIFHENLLVEYLQVICFPEETVFELISHDCTGLIGYSKVENIRMRNIDS